MRRLLSPGTPLPSHDVARWAVCGGHADDTHRRSGAMNTQARQHLAPLHATTTATATVVTVPHDACRMTTTLPSSRRVTNEDADVDNNNNNNNNNNNSARTAAVHKGADLLSLSPALTASSCCHTLAGMSSASSPRTSSPTSCALSLMQYTSPSLLLGATSECYSGHSARCSTRGSRTSARTGALTPAVTATAATRVRAHASFLLRTDATTGDDSNDDDGQHTPQFSPQQQQQPRQAMCSVVDMAHARNALPPLAITAALAAYVQPALHDNNNNNNSNNNDDDDNTDAAHVYHGSRHAPCNRSSVSIVSNSDGSSSRPSPGSPPRVAHTARVTPVHAGSEGRPVAPALPTAAAARAAALRTPTLDTPSTAATWTATTSPYSVRTTPISTPPTTVTTTTTSDAAAAAALWHDDEREWRDARDAHTCCLGRHDDNDDDDDDVHAMAGTTALLADMYTYKLPCGVAGCNNDDDAAVCCDSMHSNSYNNNNNNNNNNNKVLQPSVCSAVERYTCPSMLSPPLRVVPSVCDNGDDNAVVACGHAAAALRRVRRRTHVAATAATITARVPRAATSATLSRLPVLHHTVTMTTTTHMANASSSSQQQQQRQMSRHVFPSQPPQQLLQQQQQQQQEYALHVCTSRDRLRTTATAATAPSAAVVVVSACQDVARRVDARTRRLSRGVRTRARVAVSDDGAGENGGVAHTRRARNNAALAAVQAMLLLQMQ